MADPQSSLGPSWIEWLDPSLTMYKRRYYIVVLNTLLASKSYFYKCQNSIKFKCNTIFWEMLF